jgi:hypothetical protein
VLGEVDVRRRTNRTDQKLQVQIRVMADDPILVLRILNLLSESLNLEEAKVTGVYQNRKQTEPYRYRGYVEGRVDASRFD